MYAYAAADIDAQLSPIYEATQCLQYNEIKRPLLIGKNTLKGRHKDQFVWGRTMFPCRNCNWNSGMSGGRMSKSKCASRYEVEEHSTN